MSAELYNGWYTSAVSSDLGASYGSYSSYQKHNAEKIYDIVRTWGWSTNAIAGMIGNIQIESWLNPGDATPTIGNTLADIGNSTASNHPDNAYGFLQWKGRGSTDPNNNQLVGYAIRHGAEWYDGDIQLERLSWEYNEPAKFHPQTVDGTYWTFASYAASNETAEKLAKVWMICYEGTYSVLSRRQQNAEYWYDYFTEAPDPPVPPEPPSDDWISGEDFSDLAKAYDPDITGVHIPYSEKDCIAFVNMVWQDIPVVSTNHWSLPSGTNTLWRRNMPGYPTSTYNTESPDGQNPTPVLWYKDTIANCITAYGGIPAGALLFHQISEAGPPAIPSQYAGDGIGNFAHVGIYCGNNEVMQSGGRDSSSVPGGGVHRSAYDSSAWNYVAFVVWVACVGSEPGPEPPDPPVPPTPGPDIPYWFYFCYTNKKKGVLKNVKRII